MSNTTSQAPHHNVPSRRQKRMGPAPFASFEDLSDEVRSNLESPEDKNSAGSLVRLPGIKEDATPSTPAHPKPTENTQVILPEISLIGATRVTPEKPTSPATHEEKPNSTMNLQAPFPPRIDVSRASSSSHHDDSRDSTPERELFEGIDQKGAKLGIAFKEEGTLDLRSSTEELDFQDAAERARKQSRPHSPLAPNDSLQGHQRKDSQSSEVGLLSISGRTSRLSSVGSQGSAQSRISNTSHLSVISGTSGRSCSPHKMLLETSFCGTKPPETSNGASDYQETRTDSDELEKVLLSRKHDPREAILAEGITFQKKFQPSPNKTEDQGKPRPEIKVKIDRPEVHERNKDSARPKLPKRIIAASGVEYIYIPLKGPLPEDDTVQAVKSSKPREVKSSSVVPKSATQTKSREATKKSKSATTSPLVQRSTSKATLKTSQPQASKHKREDEPKYIRIKLKPDHMYDDEDKRQPIPEADVMPDVKKPACLDLQQVNKKPNAILSAPVQREAKVELISCTVRTTDCQAKILLNSTPLSSPNRNKHSNLGSKSPSPSLSRKSSFTSLFRSRDTMVSPDSPTGTNFRRKNSKTGLFKESPDTKERRGSRSKSRDRDKTSTSTAPSSTESIDLKSKQKSVLSLFKPKKASIKNKSSTNSPEVSTPKSDRMNSEPFSKPYHETPLQGESIRIPLHSPTDSDQKIVTDKPDKFDEPIKCEQEVERDKNVCSEEVIALDSKKTVKKIEDKRQSSTSSENVVFSTKLGSNEDIFSTKLPKEKNVKNVICDLKTQIASQPSEKLPTKSVVSDINKAFNMPSVQEKGFFSKVEEILEPSEHAKSTLPSSVNGELSEKESEELNFSMDEIDTVIIKDTVRVIPKIIESQQTVVTEIINLPSPRSSLSLDKSSNDQSNHSESVKTVKTVITNNRVSMISGEEDIYSSESEKDSEIDYLKAKRELEERIESLEPERRGLVFQQDSFEDELPYTPTTLPLERSVALPIVPIKERGYIEVKTCSIDRPRSTTPINLSCLETYREELFTSSQGQSIHDIEKIKISLPREIALSCKPKSPRKPTAPRISEFTPQSPPKEGIPTSTGTIPKECLKEWINFEEIPEKRKPPRRIQTIPSKNMAEVSDATIQDNVVYTYVNPEDCKCECHESSREKERKTKQGDASKVQEDEIPLLDDEPGEEEKSFQESHEKVKQEVAISDRRSVISDSSVDISTSLEPQDANCAEQSLRTPFTSDLGISSNRSSIVSQEEVHFPENLPPEVSPKRPRS